MTSYLPVSSPAPGILRPVARFSAGAARSHRVGFLWGLLMCVAYANQASGQVARYQPRTPTVNPYNNLNLQGVGSLPAYYTFVRPQVDQFQANLAAERAFKRQQGQVSQLENDLMNQQNGILQTGTGSWYQQTGTRTGFQNTKRYFMESPSRAPSQAATRTFSNRSNNRRPIPRRQP